MRIKRILIGGKVTELPHPFVEEAEWLVLKNHELVLESIARLEKEAFSSLYKEMPNAPELGSELAYTKSMADDMRNAANQLALVSLITRLQHWINVFVKEVRKSNKGTGLVPNIRTLNRRLGESPIAITFFADLVSVRDSVIHADSMIEWTHNGKKRRVPDRYANTMTGELSFGESDLREAIEVSIRQIKWYEERLDRYPRAARSRS
jgi:hypothetical protein